MSRMLIRSWNECVETMQQNKLCCMNNAQKYLEKPLQCNICYSVFSNKTEQLEITLYTKKKRK